MTTMVRTTSTIMVEYIVVSEINALVLLILVARSCIGVEEGRVCV